MYCVYILYSPHLDQFYIGKTSDFESRLQQHLNGESTFTKRTNDWIAVGRFAVESASAADGLERRIKKSKSRKTIQRFLDGEDNLIQTTA
jgi:predicted GIY-YIG superfamily endonuclease